MIESTVRLLKEHLAGEVFTGFAILQNITLRTKRDGGSYLAVEFVDRSGRLQGNIWEEAERLSREFEPGQVVKLKGLVEEYEGRRKLNVRQIRPARADDGVDASTFLPSIDGDPAELLEQVNRLVAKVKNPYLAKLLSSFFSDPRFSSLYSRAPAGKLWHHNRLGGLLEHSLSLARLVRRMARHYPEVDHDLLLTGALLHDIGKVEELRYDTFFDYTDRGRLVGHITLGAQWTADRAAKIEGFPPDLLDRVMHLILSHQGEHGSPVQPMTREAFLLHYADEIDSKMDALKRIVDEPGTGRWRFVKLLDRWIDTGTEDGEEHET